ncbi:MAG: hypothetical protein AAGB97_06850 [Dehalococcoidia bacterium]|nr:hypothetical protein [Chloroflexota bacterium]MBT9162056.1 hypothetical protein [Chloroflexota bacterium]
MTFFRIDVHRKSGEVMLWMETACGLKPIIRWSGVSSVPHCSSGKGGCLMHISDGVLSPQVWVSGYVVTAALTAYVL